MTAPASPAPTAWERYKRLPLVGRVLLALLAAVAIVEFVMGLASPLAGGGEGAGSSSYSARPAGLGAYAELLAAAGHEVTREREPLHKATLPADATVIATNGLGSDEIEPARRFLEGGGRMVLTGEAAADPLTDLLGSKVAWTGEAVSNVDVSDPALADGRRVLPTPETVGVDAVTATRGGAWEDTGPALPIVAAGIDSRLVLAAVADVGRGRVVLLADLSPLQNDHLARADNAAFAVNIAGGPDRPVVFAEARVGSSAGRGLNAIPDNWKWALVAGGIATLLAMWSAGRRFGPPQLESRDLPPPRRGYVDAVAATLAKTKQPGEAMAPLRTAARRRLAQRAALAPDAPDTQLRQAAEELGLAPDEIDALFGATESDESAMALGRAVARMGGTRW